MADIYAFGPDWALPAAVQDNIVSLIGSKTWVQPNVTSGTPMSSLTTGLHPLASSVVATEMGLPAASDGWLEVLVLSDTQRRYTWYPSTTRTPWRNTVYNGTWTGWALSDTSWCKRNLTASDDPGDLPEPGIYFYFSGAVANGHGMPISRISTLEHVVIGTMARQIQRDVYGTSAYTRSKTGTSWSTWSSLSPDLSSYLTTTTADGRYARAGVASASGGSGVKTVPLALTLSAGPNTSTITSADVVRMPLLFGVSTPRFRLHGRNFNRRTGATSAGTLTVDGVYLSTGDTTTGAPSGAQQKIIGGFTTPADGAEYVSPWVEVPIAANVGHLLSISVASSTGELSTPVGSCFRTGAAWSTSSTTPGTHTTRVPLEWWIEVEVPAQTPVVGFYGDSISSGTGAVQPVFNSWGSRYCRRIGALPMHWCAPGTGMVEQRAAASAAPQFWGTWDGYSRPDVAVHFMGQNDLSSATDLATMKARYREVLPKIREHLSPVVHSVTLTPSSGKTTEVQTIARDYNTWLRTLPEGERGVFDAAALLGNTGGTALKAEYDSGDALHPSDAGYVALAGAFTYPITSLTIPAGGTTTAAQDTGWVSVSPSAQGTGGKLWLRRVGDEVRLRMEAMTIAAGSYAGYIAALPAWAKPAGAEFWHVSGAASGAEITAWQRVGIYSSGMDMVGWIQTAAGSTTRPTTTMSGSHRYNTVTVFPASV